MNGSALETGRWYVDVSGGAAEGCFFKVLTLGTETLQVIDLNGHAREVNRLLFEAQMTPARRVPMMRERGE